RVVVHVHGDNRSENLLAHHAVCRIVGFHHGGLDEPTLAAVVATAGNDFCRLPGIVDVFGDARKRLLVDDGGDEVAEVAHVALLDLAHHRDATITHVVPQRARDVR